ncbi:hypothetical protein FRC10_010872 [Ceratobasidium sp. 414]|nr:hypothetical protein FRC10_010872 [Ceratobasidium sp. 414]
MYATNTWPVPCNERYYSYDQPQQTSSTTESSPISPQQFVDWFGSSPIESPYAPQSYLEPMGARSYVEEPEEAEFEAEQEQDAENRTGKRKQESSETESKPASPRKRRRHTGEDGEKKMIRRSRACMVCRNSKGKCVPGPSQREPGEDSPCMRCSTTGQECVFTASRRGKYPNEKFARLQKQLERMERMHHLLDKALRAQTLSRRYAYHLV